LKLQPIRLWILGKDRIVIVCLQRDVPYPTSGVPSLVVELAAIRVDQPAIAQLPEIERVANGVVEVELHFGAHYIRPGYGVR
jgi:hypothetical protein